MTEGQPPDYDERHRRTRLELADAGGMEGRLSAVMNRFPEVEWDRWAVQGGFGSVFGWVDRPEEQELWVEVARLRAEVIELAEMLGDSGTDADLALAVAGIRRLAEALEGLPLRRDFLVLEVVEGHVHGFATSSARHSEEFGLRLGFEGGEDTPCRRVEADLPDVERAVRL